MNSNMIANKNVYKIQQFILFVTSVDIIFVTFIDTLSVTFIISFHTVTELSITLFKYLLFTKVHALRFQL